MTFLEYFLTFSLIALYIACILTVCYLTFKKGYMILGIAGIFFPILWLVGAILPPKRGSRYAKEREMRGDRMIEEMTL